MEPGAVLLGSASSADFPPGLAGDEPAVRRIPRFRSLLLAHRCENVAVTGFGTLDGAHGCREELERDRPRVLQFIGCRRVAVRDVRLRNAGGWMQHYLWCDEVLIDGISVWNHGNACNDGLDVDGSHDARISNCDIDSHDDALVFKSTGPRGCRNIVVSNCRLSSNCHGIKFGTESVVGFENVAVANCTVSASRQPSPMDGFPAGRPPITGCALECTDGGTMRGIRIEGLIADGVFAPLFVKLGNRNHALEGPRPDVPAGRLEDIQIRGVLGKAAAWHVCSISGFPGHPVRGLRLTEVDLVYPGGCPSDRILREVPENSAWYPEINMFHKNTGRELPAWGLYLRHVEGLAVRDLSLRTLKEDARKPIVAEDVARLSLAGVRVNGEPFRLESGGSAA